MELIRASHPDRPAYDIAVSHALLLEIAAGERPPAVRLYRPAATLAFGRLDALRPGYAAAAAAAGALGFAPVLRLGGGHAAAYGPDALVYEELLADGRLDRLHERFRAVASGIAGALAAAGAPVSVGRLAGEYCPGVHSLIAAGEVKVGGLAQRVVRGGALCSASLVVEGGAAVREVLTAVYAALELDWDPATAGDLGGALTLDAAEAVLADGARRRGAHQEGSLGARTLRRAETLLARHQIAA